MGDDDRVVPIDPDLSPDDPAEPALIGHRRVPRRRRGRAQPDVLAVIAIGGVAGSLGRYGLARLLPASPGQFPWATFWTDVAGSFLLGFSLILLLERFPPTRYLRPFLATGVLGAFTTMSTYLVDVAVMIRDGHLATGISYGLGTLAAGLLLAYAGIVTARLMPHLHHRELNRRE